MVMGGFQMNVLSRRMGLILTVILYITLAAAILGFLVIPWLVQVAFAEYFSQQVASFLFLYAGGALVIWLIVEFLFIMDSVHKGTPFIQRNVKSLSHIAICCGICSVDFLGYYLFCKPASIPLLICGLILIFGMLCAIVLSCVFHQAVLYKEENDLTV